MTRKSFRYRLTTAAQSPLWKYRQLTSSGRSLPDFIVIGAHKTGTTSLHEYLGKHPQLLSSYKKETHFFDGGLDRDVDTYLKGEAWYRSHFPRTMSLHTNQQDLRNYTALPVSSAGPGANCQALTRS